MSAQMYDNLIYKGKTLWLAATPLEDYFSLHPDKRPNFTSFNSACMRGYVAFWEVRGDDRLYLVAVEMKNESESSFASLFPEGNSGIFADWVSGELVCPSGKILKHDHAGFGNVREFELHFFVNKGVVERTEEIKNS